MQGNGASTIWSGPLKKLGIRHRKFYATRHTFITEAIKRGENPLSVAQYCGTSLAMIQADHCGTLGLSFNQSVFELSLDKA
jgi:integrase